MPAHPLRIDFFCKLFTKSFNRLANLKGYLFINYTFALDNRLQSIIQISYQRFIYLYSAIEVTHTLATCIKFLIFRYNFTKLCSLKWRIASGWPYERHILVFVLTISYLLLFIL